MKINHKNLTVLIKPPSYYADKKQVSPQMAETKTYAYQT
jgi:hypothetical protein